MSASFPPGWTGIKRWLWRLLPLSVRSAWSPYDNWLRGYSDGYTAARTREQRAIHHARLCSDCKINLNAARSAADPEASEG